jgi:hypothetical protein
MDFAGLDTKTLKRDAENLYPMRLKDPNGDPTDATIFIIGANSEEYVAAVERYNKSAQQASDTIELFAACIKGWENIQLAGEELEFTPENTIMFLTQFEWVSRWLLEGLSDYKNFTKPKDKK